MTTDTIDRRADPAPKAVRRPHEAPRLAVALHGVGASTYEQCALIREWLDDLGVDRVTLCMGARQPPPRPGSALAAWLQERWAHGDVVVLELGEPPALDRWTAAGLPRPVWPGRRATRRIDVHPGDLDAGPRRTRAVERVLRREAGRRRAVTLDELSAGIPADPRGVALAP
jgi:hypothetical protein